MPSRRSVSIFLRISTRHVSHLTLRQTDTRIGSIEVKIKKLDADLVKYREQMKPLREGPGKVRSRLRAVVSALF